MSQEVLGHFKKGPGETLDYTIEWTAWLDGDTINAVTDWALDGLTLESQSGSFTSLQTALLSGGTIGQRYKISNTIQTAASKIAVRSFYIDVVER